MERTKLLSPPLDRIARITVEQYHKMIETGILKEGAPIELRKGMLVYKDRSARGEDPMTIGIKHIFCVGKLARLDSRLNPFGRFIQTQQPVVVYPEHEPEPDGAIVRGELGDYLERKVEAMDVSCVMEVADSTLDDDRTSKLAEYAESGLSQYIIVNIPDNQIEVYEQPVPAEGRYAQSSIVRAGQDVSLNVGEGRRLNVPAQDLLP